MLADVQALFLTHSDVDSTGKSYYGETNLYLVSLDGTFDGLVELDKEGPIGDFVWSPTSREFTVCYGCKSLLRPTSIWLTSRHALSGQGVRYSRQACTFVWTQPPELPLVPASRPFAPQCRFR